jgi:hypothetical protein
MRLLIYILIFYLIYRVVKYFINNKIESQTQKEYYTIDEYGIPRKEKDITNQVKIIEEKRFNQEE